MIRTHDLCIPWGRSGGRGRRGVTLVEMMVVVAIVVLMMSVLAEIFGLAGNVVSTQRTLGELDQKIRQVSQLIRSDLANHTAPLAPPVRSGSNLGYLAIAENSPADAQGEDTDDVLALTTSVPSGTSGSNLFFGLNGANGTTSSQTAEVIYFLRNGVLFRRQLLVGVPQAPAATANYPFSGSSFYENFDISARPPLAAPSGGQFLMPQFNNLSDLVEPYNRFAHQRYSSDSSISTKGIAEDPVYKALHSSDRGYVPYPVSSSIDPTVHTNFPFLPIEFADTSGANPAQFHSEVFGGDFNRNFPAQNPTPHAAPDFSWFGRPTLLETVGLSGSKAYGDPLVRFCESNPDTLPANTADVMTGGPASIAAAPPDNPNAGVLPFTFIPPTSLTIPSSTSRTAEDVILTNVLSFDVKVWDEGAAAFVDMGSTQAVDFAGDGGPPPLPWNVPITPTSASPYTANRRIPNVTTSSRSQGIPNRVNNAAAHLRRTFDTWSTGLTFSIPDTDPTFNPPRILNVVAPYQIVSTGDPTGADTSTTPPTPISNKLISTPVPLRAVQIKIRFHDAKGKFSREVTIVQDLTR